MELVYLWVEEYKNIRNQGFNFSPRFTCKYENGELTIEEKKDYVSIFPENINVTAIVGENGSSKSSILEAIKLLFTYHGENIFHCIWKIENNLYSYGALNNSKVNFITNLPIFKILDRQEMKINYFTHSSDVMNTLLWMNQKNKLYDCSNDMVFGFLSVQNPNNLRTDDLLLNIPIYYTYCQKLLLKYFLKQNSKNEIFNPTHYQIMITKTYFIRKITAILSYDEREGDKTLDEIKLDVQKYVDNLLNKQNNLPIINRLYFFLEKIKYNSNTNIINYLHSYIKRDEIPSKNEIEQELIILYEELPPELSILDTLTMNEDVDFKIHKNTLLQILKNKLFKNIFVDLYKIVLFEKKQTTKIFYDDLSSGEKDTLLLLSLLHNYFEEENVNQHSLVLLDEIETFYHPNWSKKLIKILVNQLKKQTHLILTSHSPFLLSDLPKQNVIFLEKGKQVYPNIETFGANIHTLLSHGFFMKDGLMGEFAKEKINKAITILNKQGRLSKSSLEYCEQIISIIGEPILKRQLQRMLDSKRLYKMDEIDRLKADISELHQKLKKLENRK